MNFRSSGKSQSILTKMDSDLFPLLFDEPGEARKEPVTTLGGRQVRTGDLLDIISLRPFDSEIQPFSWNQQEGRYPSIAPPANSAGWEETAAKYSRWDDAEILFTGTASALPGKYRNGQLSHRKGL